MSQLNACTNYLVKGIFISLHMFVYTEIMKGEYGMNKPCTVLIDDLPQCVSQKWKQEVTRDNAGNCYLSRMIFVAQEAAFSLLPMM